MNRSIGTVYLIGAGPGDPDLITVKGLRLLRQANVVLYDALLSQALLDEISLTAQTIFVGKRAGNHAMSQEEINQLLCDMAHQHRIVVRLKGGDPFVFGRGSEEMLYLRATGVPVEVVPGVTSAIGALAYAGIPVTHRKIAANFAVVTGHRAKEATAEQPWHALAHVDTLVILMGLQNLTHITAELLAAGRPPDTPAVAVHWGTSPAQEVVAGTLGNLAERVLYAKLQAPATIVIGEVAAFAEQLNWFPQWQPVAEVLPQITSFEPSPNHHLDFQIPAD